ncbi:MAG: hypothetical protein UT55_C0024G0005 [Candidatus Peregrinibacteria bacterium GW2011_GWE2_39_6]|nr:MAG: hypothetical protein UT36_C0001G0023 [Candidatus Peregrinibacteria bacterium GW2011_GWF2_39_17]KKR25932.1 MAG: hypothetical protein UT55_C0024G0005 [Candidatus Peregrinibacteria bacterium GW2011_GWE2_39_6]HCW32364.1 hypothetical protein [Candidatus Peregrinibacteria bacterium]
MSEFYSRIAPESADATQYPAKLYVADREIWEIIRKTSELLVDGSCGQGGIYPLLREINGWNGLTTPDGNFTNVGILDGNGKLVEKPPANLLLERLCRAKEKFRRELLKMQLDEATLISIWGPIQRASEHIQEVLEERRHRRKMAKKQGKLGDRCEKETQNPNQRYQILQNEAVPPGTGEINKLGVIIEVNLEARYEEGDFSAAVSIPEGAEYNFVFPWREDPESMRSLAVLNENALRAGLLLALGGNFGRAWATSPESKCVARLSRIRVNQHGQVGDFGVEILAIAPKVATQDSQALFLSTDRKDDASLEDPDSDFFDIGSFKELKRGDVLPGNTINPPFRSEAFGNPSYWPPRNGVGYYVTGSSGEGYLVPRGVELRLKKWVNLHQGQRYYVEKLIFEHGYLKAIKIR